MTTTTQVVLDRAQRAAIRSELELCASGWGDLMLEIRRGNRENVYRALKRLRRMAEVLDAIGWSEQSDTPDRMPVCRSRSLAAWARREAKDLLGAFDEFEPEDGDLDAYEALRVLGEPARELVAA